MSHCYDTLKAHSKTHQKKIVMLQVRRLVHYLKRRDKKYYVSKRGGTAPYLLLLLFFWTAKAGTHVIALYIYWSLTRECGVMKKKAEGRVERFIYPSQHPTSPHPYMPTQTRSTPALRHSLNGYKRHTFLPLTLLPSFKLHVLLETLK
jgi:hypothetical protein